MQCKRALCKLYNKVTQLIATQSKSNYKQKDAVRNRERSTHAMRSTLHINYGKGKHFSCEITIDGCQDKCCVPKTRGMQRTFA